METSIGLTYIKVMAPLDTLTRHPKTCTTWTPLKIQKETTMFNTLMDKKDRYNTHIYNKYKISCKLQRIIGCPSVRGFIQYIQNNKIPNLPVPVTGIKTAEYIFVPDMVPIKGKTSRSKPKPVEIH